MAAELTKNEEIKQLLTNLGNYITTKKISEKLLLLKKLTFSDYEYYLPLALNNNCCTTLDYVIDNKIYDTKKILSMMGGNKNVSCDLLHHMFFKHGLETKDIETLYETVKTKKFEYKKFKSMFTNYGYILHTLQKKFLLNDISGNILSYTSPDDLRSIILIKK